MAIRTYNIDGMTCGHCVKAVTDEVGQIAGVTGVEVDLTSGQVTVESDRTVEAAAVTAAVEEAGYAVSS